MEIIKLENEGEEERICIGCGCAGNLKVKVIDEKNVYYLCSDAVDAAIEDYVGKHS